jgi:hypothetical protein
MAEWLKAHAWKSTPAARADAHPFLPTHSPIKKFRDNNARRHVPVNDALHQGFRGVCDTVLTQSGFELTQTHIDEHQVIRAQRRVRSHGEPFACRPRTRVRTRRLADVATERGAEPETYADFAKPIFATLAQVEMVTKECNVAEAV